MSRNGAGVYTFPSGSWNPAVAGTDVDAVDWNTLAADLATAVSQSIASTGVTTITANLPMSGFKHTSVGAASARTQYGQVAQIQDGVYSYAVTSGASAYTATLFPTITAYTAGMVARLKIGTTNPITAPTLQLNGIASPKTIVNPPAVALLVGQLQTNGIYEFVYDGTNWQVMGAVRVPIIFAALDTDILADASAVTAAVGDYGWIMDVSDSNKSKRVLTPYSDTYTPTLTGVSNVDGTTAATCQYSRVGSTVTVSGKLAVDPTLTATATIVGISLPIASNFSSDAQLGGYGGAQTASEPAVLYADPTNDRAEMMFVSVTTVSHTLNFSFQYQLL